MTKIQKLIFILLFSTFYFLFSIPLSTLAVEFYFEPRINEINVNQFIKVDFFVDTQGEEINALEGTIKLPENILKVQRVSDGNTIIGLWLERPAFDENNDEIRFSGIMPGGYQGESGFIFSISLIALEQGKGAIEIKKARAFLNDGEGTETEISINSLEMAVSDEAMPFLAETEEDLEPPEAFMPELANDPNVFGGKWFLSFATHDKKSGIAYYEVYEGRRENNVSKIGSNKWAKAISPYVIKDQNLRSYIYVKAVDNEGNERVAVVEPKNPMEWYENYFVWILIILVIIIITWVIKNLLKKHTK